MSQQTQQKIRLYKIDGKKIAVVSADFGLFTEQLKSQNQQYEFIGDLDGFVQHQQHTIVEGSAKEIVESGVVAT